MHAAESQKANRTCASEAQSSALARRQQSAPHIVHDAGCQNVPPVAGVATRELCSVTVASPLPPEAPARHSLSLGMCQLCCQAGSHILIYLLFCLYKSARRVSSRGKYAAASDPSKFSAREPGSMPEVPLCEVGATAMPGAALPLCCCRCAAAAACLGGVPCPACCASPCCALPGDPRGALLLMSAVPSDPPARSCNACSV